MGKEHWNTEGFTEVTLKLKRDECGPKSIVRDEGKTVPVEGTLQSVWDKDGLRSVWAPEHRVTRSRLFVQAVGGRSRTSAKQCFRQSPLTVL